MTPDKILKAEAERLERHKFLHHVIILSTEDGGIQGYSTAQGIPKRVMVEYLKLMASVVDRELLDAIEYQCLFLPDLE